ncbi:MAG: dTDP-4-dehydrorhamnose reductase [Proteobacteria bacterium]|nr:dTDP-4-dehydrorhamnose reductase [Pseudomonadota bacterium]
MHPSALVIGRTGQLARELARAPCRFQPVFLGREEADLTRPEEAAAAVERTRPALVVLAAAYTAVDRAESEPETARLANTVAPGVVAEACARVGAALVHVSTDMVFDGAKDGPYVETDPPAPLGVYGQTKLDGEGRVLGSGARAAVVRTSWVFGASGANFVQLVLRLAAQGGEMRIVGDQVGRPTGGGDLARAVWAMGDLLVGGEAAAEGLFHYAGADDATRSELAEAIVAGSAARGGPAARVLPIATADYPTPARRPLNARLDSGRLNRLGVASRPWRPVLDEALDQLLGPRTRDVS